MNWAHVHLILNHVPVLGSVFCLLLVAVGWAMADLNVKRVALAMTLLTGLAALPVYFTGEPAEHVVEGLPGVNERAIHEHEEFSTYALVAALVTGAAAGVALAFTWRDRDGRVPRWASPAILALLLVTTGLMGWTAYLGGRIHHPETEFSFAPASDGRDAGPVV